MRWPSNRALLLVVEALFMERNMRAARSFLAAFFSGEFVKV